MDGALDGCLIVIWILMDANLLGLYTIYGWFLLGFLLYIYIYIVLLGFLYIYIWFLGGLYVYNIYICIYIAYGSIFLGSYMDAISI